ncbi:hypothetical protein PYS61_01575 [Amygdalobacter indicium]|uniref:Uncharacterized protein n=1 Tax=Amygdalobacter indicium TaxID=3029272 RepID=A0ABY8C9B9_9FIRM|nr:hypothetical protein [Amygdalobacter indicium]WEG35883.1 hypothetical protein PYS61_01575 [Amygdalobacter indicium]
MPPVFFAFLYKSGGGDEEKLANLPAAGEKRSNFSVPGQNVPLNLHKLL